MDADRALPGELAQTDGCARGTFLLKAFVQNTVTKRQENSHVYPKAYYLALINQHTARGHFTLQKYFDR